MTTKRLAVPIDRLAPFDRDFFGSEHRLMRIGAGNIGGKASGLAMIHDTIARAFPAERLAGITVDIPRLTVLGTTVFDQFMDRNGLWDLANSDVPDDRIAHAFQHANMPAELVGDLRALSASAHRPLAVRSSSLLEDAMHRPFAGVYGTKMIPNNQPDIDTRFQRLVEAIKFVYASTFFRSAKEYRRTTSDRADSEKMAVIVQEVIGRRHGDRFYPDISGVARSYNYYPTGHAKPDDGVVNLALGLGKTIVDGALSWSYSPAFPRAWPPVGAASDLLGVTQTRFWAIHMGEPPEYDPIRETEYLVQASLPDAEQDDTLDLLVSTYDGQNDRVVMGAARPGPRILTFAPVLSLGDIPLNELLLELLPLSEEVLGSPVEIEFAVVLSSQHEGAARFGFLQVRPLVVSHAKVDIAPEEMSAEGVLAASETVLGNGIVDSITDVVYVKPEAFDAKHSRQIAQQLDMINRSLVEQQRPYLLIGFGRWGSTDPWLGIPVRWDQISGARVIVEATLPNMNVELSQGAHFFHNLMSFQICYFSIPHAGTHRIDWDRLDRELVVQESAFVRHARLSQPLTVKVDGQSGRGVIAT